jgi:hypothetical protein
MNYKEIPISDGRAIAIVDEDNFWWLNTWKWSLMNGYARRMEYIDGRHVTIAMHREIIGAPREADVDHINGNPLDNRRSNLRIARASDNTHNASHKSIHGYKGVVGAAGLFQARINAGKKTICLGTFPTARDAAVTVDSAARWLHGPFARLNVPEIDTEPMSPMDIRKAHLKSTGWADGLDLYLQPFDPSQIPSAVPIKRKAQKSRPLGKCGFLGVTQKRDKFEARVTIGRKTAFRGVFWTAEEAARAYDKAILQFDHLRKIKRGLNFPEEYETALAADKGA